MAAQTPPWAIQGSTHSAEVARNYIAATFAVPVATHTAASSVTTVGGGHGVVDDTDLSVTQNGTPNMSVNVAAGRAIIRSGGASSLLAGSYTFLNDGTVNLAIAAADATNPRRDLVVAQVRDTNYGEAASDARLVVVTGTPAASPADPALTSFPNALVLARVAVAAGATSITTANITDLRTYAVTVGGTAWCTSTTRPSGASLRDGLRIYELDTRRTYVYNSTSAAWVSANEPIICTSSTRPTSPLYDGLFIYETDTKRVLVYNGTAWTIVSAPKTTYTPSLLAITVGTGGTNSAMYHINRNKMFLQGNIIYGTAGQLFPSGAAIGATLPGGFTYDGPDAAIVGQCRMRDSSVPQNYRGNVQWVSASNALIFNIDNVGATYPTLAAPSATVPFAAAWASGDSIEWTATVTVA